jgi:hypothetical protein
MSWELIELKLEETSGPVQVYNFEARLHKEEGSIEFRGDGIYMARTRQLRLNRESELAVLLRERLAPPLPPYTPKSKAVHFDATALISELKQLLQARVANPTVIAKRRAATASPAQASGFAYMLRWDV